MPPPPCCSVALQCCNKEYNTREDKRMIHSIYHNVLKIVSNYFCLQGWKVLIATLQHATLQQCLFFRNSYGFLKSGKEPAESRTDFLMYQAITRTN